MKKVNEHRKFLQDYCTFDIAKSRLNDCLIDVLYEVLTNTKITFKITKGEIDFIQFKRNIGKIHRTFGDTYGESTYHVRINCKRLEGNAVVLRCSARNADKLESYLKENYPNMYLLDPIYPMSKTEVCLVNSW